MGHVRMMAAVQPFLSGAISKTVNMAEEATPEEIANVYQEAWRLGLKAIAIYRDGFSHTQFEPSGWSGVKEIGYAKSIMDYISRWLALRFLPPTSPPPTGAGVQAPAPAPAHLWADVVSEGESDAPACRECGAIMSRNGSCYRCWNCGWTSGCS
jgi:ribonucleotide reductase alpha subunit